MKLHISDVGTVIAERRLQGKAKGKLHVVTVRIGKPFHDEEDEACWYCPYSIQGGEDLRLFYGAGVDSLQALRIAISMISADLTSIFAHLELTWNGEQDLGFSERL